MSHRHEGLDFVPDAYPPFPINEAIRIAHLDTISLRKVVEGDNVEGERVFEACKTSGFFYLDLEGADLGTIILEGSRQLAAVTERVMALPLAEKLMYLPHPRAKTMFGYKAKGTSVVDCEGRRDTVEYFNVSKDDMIRADDQMQSPWPGAVLDSKPLFASYSKAAHDIGMALVRIVASKLGMDAEELSRLHSFEQRAGDHIRLTKGPPRVLLQRAEIQTPPHTDFGTITILMNWLGGLQIWSTSSRTIGTFQPDTPGEWLFVKPKAGHAIVNLGDALVKFTNGVLCSGRHRVVPAPGEQGRWPRYSVVYFVRPNNHARLRVLKGDKIPASQDTGDEGIEAQEWIYRQAVAMAQPDSAMR